MKIILNGACGRMGQEVINAIAQSGGKDEIVAAVDITAAQTGCPFYPSLDQVEAEADVLIDFSHHAATDSVLAFAIDRHIPTVIATTGQTEQEKNAIEQAAKKIPLFYSGNMSIGIALLVSLVKTAIQTFPDADVEIVETHHNQKLDVPSGTALMLAQGIEQARQSSTICVGRHQNGKRPAGEIGIHSVRMGKIVGIHEVHINTGSQTLTLKHEAHSRALFAEGALQAASFLKQQPTGLYSVSDLFN